MTAPRMRSLPHPGRAVAVVLAGVAAALPVWGAGLSLTAADAPVNTPWSEPANLSVTREAGTSTVTADLVLNYQSETRYRKSAGFASKGSYSVGVYLHRDTTATAPRNDRGVAVSYAGLLVSDFSNAGPVGSLGYAVKLGAGKSVVEVEAADGSRSWVDKTKIRLVASLGGYLQPALGGGPTPGVIAPILFFDGGPAVYVDQLRGQGIQGSGRVTGGQLKLGANLAPMGLEPVPMAGLAMVPTLRVAAQVQRDFSASDSRTRQTRKLYSLELNLLFGRPEEEAGKLVPSLQLARSVGADLLTGRAESAKTELSLGLTF